MYYAWLLSTLGHGGPSYIKQLERLQAGKPTRAVSLPAAMVEITTPLISEVWETELANHPDRAFAAYVVNGIKRDFRIGSDHSKSLSSCSTNNRMMVVSPSQAPSIQCHISPFGVIPKRAKPGKWRLIVDLSSPSNASVNDGIDRDMCSVSYITVDQIVDEILRLGQGTLMAKADIKQAYRMVPVYPTTAICWQCNGRGRHT